MIETQRLLIDAFCIEDADALSMYRSKEEVACFQSWNHYPLVKAKKRIEYCIEHPLSNKAGNYQLAVRLKKAKILIGDYFIEVNNSQTVTIGYTFDSQYWSNGYASESFKALIEYLKDYYHFKLVLCYVYNDNVRSIRLLENNGFEEFERSRLMHDIGYKKILKN